MLEDLARRVFGYEDTVPGLRNWYRKFRLWYQTTFKYQLVSVGKDVIILRGTHIRPHSVSIGDYSAIGPGCLFEAKVEIGRYCLIAANVSIIGADHRFDLPGVPMIRAGRQQMKPVVIEDDVWIGRGVTIMHGVRIGEGAIVSAGSFVSQNVEPYTIVGSPSARVLWRRFDRPELVEQHRAALAQLRETGQDYRAPLPTAASLET